MKDLITEQAYLNQTLHVIDETLSHETSFLDYLRTDARRHNKEMIEETSTDYSDPIVRAELSAYLQSFRQNEDNLKKSSNRVDKLLRMKEKPYFGRLDFTEEGLSKESLYIGIGHLFDKKTLDILIYDWRSPIASLYYENKYGTLSYESPEGIVSGLVDLKRQFLFKDHEVIHYFDLKENVVDHQLLEVLSNKGKQTLHAVVETIQEKQNDIIRTQDIDLLFVKGVPGSGKSIIALHRLAYLMYHGQKKYNSSNMLVLSPNDFFTSYIENVLPELGEKSVVQKTFEDILVETFGNSIETYGHHMDRIMRQKISPFKHTEDYYTLLKVWLDYYLKFLHPYEDLYYHNEIIVTRQTIKNWMMKHQRKSPLKIGSEQFKSKGYSHQEVAQKHVQEKLKAIVVSLNNYPFNPEEGITRKLTLYNRRFKHQMNKVLNIHTKTVYEKMFEHKDLVKSLVNFDVPDHFFIRSNLYEDYHGMMLLHFWINGCHDYKHFKYVVVDESQDYNPVQLRVLRNIFPKSHFTILGDMNQTLHHLKASDYKQQLQHIFSPKKMHSIELDTCYRSTESITKFANQYISQPVQAFSRQGQSPKVIKTTKLYQTLSSLISKDDTSTAIIVHTASEARQIAKRLKYVSAVTGHGDNMNQNIIVIPIYYAKGLEFDKVIFLNNKQHHPLHHQLAYTAATRAKHELFFIEKEQSL